MYNKTLNRGDKGFNEVLDRLSKEYKGTAGGPEAEVIVNWNKAEAVETKTVSFYATNKELAMAIKRGRDAILQIQVFAKGAGAGLHFDQKRVRPLATVVRPARS